MTPSLPPSGRAQQSESVERSNKIDATVVYNIIDSSNPRNVCNARLSHTSGGGFCVRLPGCRGRRSCEAGRTKC